MYTLLALPLAILSTLTLGAPTAPAAARLAPRITSGICTYHIYYSQGGGDPYIASEDITLTLYAPRTDPTKQGKELLYPQGISAKYEWGDMANINQHCWNAAGLNEAFCITPTAPINKINNNWVLTFQIGNGTTFASPEPADCPLSKRGNKDTTAGPNGMVVGCLDGGGQDGTTLDGVDISMDGSFSCTGNFS